MRRIPFIRAWILMTPLALLPCFADEAKTPVGHWAFNEGTGEAIADSSGNDHHGKIANDMRAVTWVEGRNGKALQFSGGNPEERSKAGCVVIPGLTQQYDFSKAITVEAWIRLAPTTTREGNYEIVSNTESDRGKGFRLRIAWSMLMFGSGEGGDGKTWQAQSSPAKSPINPEVWYHVAGTYDGSVFKVYLDGEEVGVSEPGLSLTTGQKDVFIGAYCGGYAYGFEGVIDDVKIYDYALSPAQILKHAKLDN